MRFLILAALAAVTFSIAPTNAQPQPKEPDLAKRVRDLEERLAVVEKKLSAPTALIPFGDVTVNLAEERLMRYLRLKMSFLVDEKDQRDLSALMNAKKPELKNFAIVYLTGKSVKDVSGPGGVAKVSEDLKEGFGKILQGDRKENPLKMVYFEEYIVQ